MGSIQVQSSFCESANEHPINAIFPWTTFIVSIIMLSLIVVTISKSRFKHSFATPFITANKYLTYATIFYPIIVFSNGIAALITTLINVFKYPRFCRYDTIISVTSNSSTEIASTPYSGREDRFISLWMVLWVLTMLIILRIMFAIFHKGVNKDLNGEAMIEQPQINIIQQTPDGKVLSSTWQSQPAIPAIEGSNEMNNWKQNRIIMAILCVIIICGFSLMFKPLYLVDRDGNGSCHCTDGGMEILGKNVLYIFSIGILVGIISCITGICCICTHGQRKKILTGFGVSSVVILFWIVQRVFVKYGRDIYYGVTYITVIYCVVIVILHIIICQSKGIESAAVESTQMNVQIVNNEETQMTTEGNEDGNNS